MKTKIYIIDAESTGTYIVLPWYKRIKKQMKLLVYDDLTGVLLKRKIIVVAYESDKIIVIKQKEVFNDWNLAQAKWSGGEYDNY